MNQQNVKSKASTSLNQHQTHSLTESLPPSLENELTNIPFFESVKKERGINWLNRLAAIMNKLNLLAGHQIYNSLSKNRVFVYVVHGSVNLYGYQTNSKSTFEFDPSACVDLKLVTSISQNGYFGHYEFINGSRITQAIAGTSCTVITIPLSVAYSSFKGILQFPDLQEKVEFLLKVSIFEDIDAFSLEKLIITSETIIVNKGCNLYEENTPATHVYIVFQGTFEIIRKIESIESLTSQDVHISCVSEYQILGAEDLFLDGQSYSETVHCVSLRGVLLKIPNQRFTHMIRNKKRIMELCKSRENWKRNRVQMLEKTFTTQFPVQFANKPKRVMSSVSRPMKVYARTQAMESLEGIDLEQCLSRRSHLSSKKSGFFKNEQEYLNYKYLKMERVETASQKLRSVFELKHNPNEKIYSHQRNRNMSELVLTKFLTKKNKIENRMIFDYLKTRPPELILDANKEFAIFKPLHITESSAVRNRKKTVSMIKAKYFKPAMPLNLKR